MEIILLADVRHLGDKDDVVKVKSGYANNYLIPQGMAVLATPTNKKIIAENQRQAAHRQERIKADAQNISDLLSALVIKIPMLVGKEGKIYGSVTPLQLCNILKEKGFDVDRRKVTILSEITTPGEYKALVNLHKEVKIEITFEVVNKEAQ